MARIKVVGQESLIDITEVEAKNFSDGRRTKSISDDLWVTLGPYQGPAKNVSMVFVDEIKRKESDSVNQMKTEELKNLVGDLEEIIKENWNGDKSRFFGVYPDNFVRWLIKERIVKFVDHLGVEYSLDGAKEMHASGEIIYSQMISPFAEAFEKQWRALSELKLRRERAQQFEIQAAEALEI